MKGFEVEMPPEYVKDLVWEESFKKIENQLYIFGKQHNRIYRLLRKVKVIITDSPLLNSIIYYTFSPNENSIDEIVDLVRSNIEPGKVPGDI